MSDSNDRDDDVPKSEQQPAPDNVPGSEQQPVSDDVPESEQQGYESAPADWRELAKRPTKQLEREMRELRRIEDRHSYMAWLSVMAIIPRVRALKEKYGGDTFAARCKTLCRIGKTAAGNIVRWRIAEPQILNEIWETVHAEAHAASVRGVRYEYPTLNKMCLKYKPEEDDDVTDEVSEEDEEELRDVLTGARSEEETSNNPPPNDPRTKAEITKQNLMLEDHNKTLTRKQVLLEQRLADRDTEIDQLSRRANEQRDSLSNLRELISQLKAGLAAKDAEIAAKDAEIARLRTEAVTPQQTAEPDPPPPEPADSQPDEPEPDPDPDDPEPPPASRAKSPEPDPEPDTEPTPLAEASQPVEPEAPPEPPPEPPLVPATTPPPDLPNLDDLDDGPDDQPHDDAPAICLPDCSQSGPDIQAEIELLRANPQIRAQETYQRILGTRLPPVRKLARVRRLIAEMYGLLNTREIDFARFWNDYGEGIDFIRLAMKRDSPKFDQMGTFKDYLDFACALAGEAAKEKGPR